MSRVAQAGSKSRRVDDAPAVDTSAPTATAAKPLRADAARNRDALVAAASDAFSERGVEAPLEDIARRAGVGIGTLYRHFPERDVLVEAVYRREVELLCDAVPGLQAEHAPDEALATWMRGLVRYAARKRGLAEALRSALGADNELFASSHRRITGSVETLVAAAVADGSIRADVQPTDLLRAVSGVCMASGSPGWSDSADRIVDLLMDGLRYRPAT